MSKETNPLKLPASIKAAARLVKEHGVSVNQRIGSAMVDARAEDLRAILNMVPDRAPDPGDELPAES